MKPDFWFKYKDFDKMYWIYGPLGFYKAVQTKEEAVQFTDTMWRGQQAL